MEFLKKNYLLIGAVVVFLFFTEVGKGLITKVKGLFDGAK